MVKSENKITPQALFEQGLRAHATGRLDEALGLYGKVLKVAPGHAAALHNSGMAYWQQGRAMKGLPLVRKALAAEPDHYAAHNTMGLIRTSLGQHEEAEQSFRQALGLRPDYAEACFNMARLFLMQQRWPDLLAAANELLRLKPDHALGRLMKAAALAERGRFHELEDTDDMLAALTGNVLAMTLAARVQFLRGRPELAITLYDRALEMDQVNLIALHGKAAALIEAGRTGEARACLEAVLKENPSHMLALKLLSGIHKFEEGDAVYKLLEKAQARQKNLMPKERAELHYALAKYYSDTGDAAKTFAHWRDGAAARFSMFDYKNEDDAARMARVRSILPRPVAGVTPPPKDAKLPLFIVGMPRSGTTLMEQIIASHGAVSAGGEMVYFPKALGGLSEWEGLDDAAKAQRMEEVRAHYAAWAAADLPDAKIFTDKMPYNYIYLGFINAALPQAKVMHMVRHPLDTCLSCFGLMFHTGHEWSYDLKAMGRYYRLYDEMMQHWRSVLPAGSFIDVRYESLVSDMEGTVRGVLDYCGLPWDEACLSFHENTRAVRTASTQQVRRPLYTSSVEKWRRYSAELAPVIEELEPVIKRLGYMV